MENESKIGRAWQSFTDKLQDQVWFQQIRAKWDELDGKTKTILKYAGLFGSGALLVGAVAMAMISVSDQKKEIDDKLALIQKIQGAQEELRRLKDVTSRFGGGGGQPWPAFLQERAQAAGIDPAIVTVIGETAIAAPGSGKAMDGKGKPITAPPVTGPTETVVEAALKKINVRQLTKYVHEIENGNRTVKVRRLQVDTHPDESGYLDATLVLSAFSMDSGEE